MIIEDEAPLATGLELTIKELRPETEIVAVAGDVKSAMKAIIADKEKQIDMIFADIRLEDGYSFDVFDAVETDAMIVFTTAYDEYALKAFNYECIDYILKPYSSADIEDAFRRFEKRNVITRFSDSRRVSAQLRKPRHAYRNRLELDGVRSTAIVDVDEICYAEYDMGPVQVYCKDKTHGTTTSSVTKLAAELDPSKFFKVSRTHIVKMEEIRMVRPTLRRSKILVLKEPYTEVEIEVTFESMRELKKMMKL